jgi:hypothetical protein
VVCAASRLHGSPDADAVETRRCDRWKSVRSARAVTRSATVSRRHPHGCRTPRPRPPPAAAQGQAITSAAALVCSQHSPWPRALLRPPDASRLPPLQGGSWDIWVDGRHGVPALFLNAGLTGVGLTRHPRALWRRPRAWRLISSRCRVTAGRRPWYPYARRQVTRVHVAC